MQKKDPFYTDHYYHVFNKAMDILHPFECDAFSQHFQKLAWYYRSSKCKISYSHYLESALDIRQSIESEITCQKDFQIEIVAYCIMPTHYHFLLKQNLMYGIFTFMNNVTNGFTRFYNLLNKRKGPVFIPRYKSRIIHTEEQLIHVSRYIHLNPYSSGIVSSMDELRRYRFSSLGEYLHKPVLTNPSYVLSTEYFHNNHNTYKSFVTDHADYQRSLEYCKHVEKW